MRRRWGGRLFALVAFLLLAGGLALGASRHYSQQQEVWATAEKQRDFVPERACRDGRTELPVPMSISLPGTTAAFATANIFARATGYIAKRNVDIGDQVKAGDLLAQTRRTRTRSPDFAERGDAHSAQVSAGAGEGQLNLAQVTWDRDSPLVEKGWVTQQQGDGRRPDPQGAAGGSWRRAGERRSPGEPAPRAPSEPGLCLVVAPFDGIITQRNVDVGSLVQGDATTGTFMFEIMQEAT